MFLRWWRIEEEDRRRVWELYGWFSGLMCVGSVFGAVTWGAQIQYLVVQFQSLNAQAQYWVTAFYLVYAIEFLCLTVAKLMVLDRMADFLAKSNSLSRRLAVGGRDETISLLLLFNIAPVYNKLPVTFRE